MFSKRRIILYLSVVVLALIGTIYQLLLPGLSIAREEPWELEVQVATWLLQAYSTRLVGLVFVISFLPL